MHSLTCDMNTDVFERACVRRRVHNTKRMKCASHCDSRKDELCSFRFCGITTWRASRKIDEYCVSRWSFRNGCIYMHSWTIVSINISINVPRCTLIRIWPSFGINVTHDRSNSLLRQLDIGPLPTILSQNNVSLIKLTNHLVINRKQDPGK